jgi:molecular chaperone HscB
LKTRGTGLETSNSKLETEMDHFQRLGLPRRFSVDAGELERAYLDRSRAVHPDYHLAGSGAELDASLEASAAVNEAYNTLRDPFARAEYLLTLDGEPPAAGAPKLPPAFLMEMLELREQLEAAGGDPGELAKLEAEFRTRLGAVAGELGELFGRYEALPAGDAGRANLRGQVAGLLNRARYVRGLIRDLHAGA